jgi:hypothetical protein
MYRLSAADLVRLWERGAGLHAVDRSLHVLACALPDRDAAELARLPLGRRDALLLSVREATLGSRIEARDMCPACGERVEVELACGALASGAAPPERWPLECHGYRLVLRPLDSVDAAAAAQCRGVAAAKSTLLARAVVAADRDGQPVAVEDLPGEVASAVAASIADRDSGAELMLEFACPRCAHVWQDVLDVSSFVWVELSACAQRLLLDVHTLARAYGWSESDILSLSDARRAAYLTLVTA